MTTVSILDPYLRYLSLKAQRSQDLKDINIPSVQVHSYFGLLDIPGFDRIFQATQESIREKYKARWPRPDTIPTAADDHMSKLKSSRKLLSHIALLCILPSSPTEIATQVSYHVDEVKPILVALRNKKVLREESSGRFVLSIVGDVPPSGSPVFERSVVEAALKGWTETKARREDIDESPYATLVENIRPAQKKSVKSILVLDLIRAPRAYPDEKQVQAGQLSFLFEEIYPSPLREACLFASLSMPQTNQTLRDNSSTPVGNILGDVWGKARSYGFIDDELKTTPYGERVIATLTGTPLAPFRHIRSLDTYFSKTTAFKLHSDYTSEFMKVVYSGVLYNVLAETCGLQEATQMVQSKSRVEYFLSTAPTPDFYLPKKLANRLKVDETVAKNALAQAFLYGACGISTVSHPHLYNLARKVRG